jgi:hypothetical protein
MTRYENYLRDVLTEILASAREAKADCAAQKTQVGSDKAQFEVGRALAYYEVLSLLVGELEKFDISRREVGLDPAFDVDMLLP